jgi:predicted dehydrogenase
MRMNELRFGVVGWGYWGPKIARNLDALAQGTVTMVADMDEYRLASLNISQPWIKTTARAEEVFRSEVDGVVIATPVRTHYRLAKEALLSGKHVLVEKPLTANIEEAEELVALAQEQKRILMVGHTFEYSPAVNELRKLVQSGGLGKIYCIEAERVNLGLFRSDINVIWDLAPHDISILLYVLGMRPEQIKVQAHTHLQPGIHDIAHLDLGFANGISAHIHVSWLHPCKIRRVTVIGDARMVVYDDTNPAEMIKIYNKGADVHADPVVSYRNGEITIPYIEWIEPLRLECEDFARAIVTGTQPRAHGGVGLEVVRILAAAQEVLENRGRPSVAV